ncbi:hypothetical protein [Flavobacterium terrisoli]|uniref:hypothetical protein n=1 Tax=Flavobacterium terrisoli TaxID=3242195 RepID=UPI002542F7D5|nr:hypothetical protein [Flavobacterium buctense]
MKRIISLLALIFLFNSCIPDDGPTYTFELRPVISVDMPDEFTLGETYTITLHYNRPTTCHFFNTIYYDKNLNVRTIAIETAKEERNGCMESPEDETTCSFDFLVTSNGSYIFKFWQGKDEQGNNIYLEYEIPVTG